MGEGREREGKERDRERKRGKRRIESNRRTVGSESKSKKRPPDRTDADTSWFLPFFLSLFLNVEGGKGSILFFPSFLLASLRVDL